MYRSLKVDTSIFDIDLRPSIFDHRPSIFDHRSSKIDTSIFDHRSSIIDLLDHRPSTIDLRPSTIDLRPTIIDLRIDLRPSTIDLRSSTIDLRIDLRPSIFEHRSSNTDLRRSKVETSHRQSNIAPTIRHRILSATALHTRMAKLSKGNFNIAELEQAVGRAPVMRPMDLWHCNNSNKKIFDYKKLYVFCYISEARVVVMLDCKIKNYFVRCQVFISYRYFGCYF